MGVQCCNQKCGMISLFVVGLIFVVIGAIAVVVFDLLFVEIIKQEALIEEGTTMYDSWEIVTTPTFMSYYFYNITNMNDVLKGLEGLPVNRKWIKPHMEEIGPYTYREYLSKDNITFLTEEDPEQVFYRQKTILVFDPELSHGSLDDVINTVNIIAVSLPSVAEHLLGDLNQTITNLLNAAYLSTNSKVLFSHTARDLLFGFNDPLLDIFGKIVGQNITFGLFSTANNSEGWFDYQVYTGRSNIELTNVITTFNGMTKLDYWTGDECNMINGTDGTTTPPFMNRDDRIYFFVDDICRSIFATYEADVQIKRVPAWKYVIPPEAFAAPNYNPENYCFCPEDGEPLCNYSGAVSIQNCMFGAPIMVSSPHFLFGSEYYNNQTTGITAPSKEEHETALVFEPNTGAAIKVDKRLQINVVLRSSPGINLLQNIDTVIPILWLNESATVGQSDADLLYGLLVVPKDVVAILQIVLCCVGSVMAVVPLFYLMLCSQNEEVTKNHTKQKQDIKANAYENSGVVDEHISKTQRF